jgi:hypothetical protein
MENQIQLMKDKSPGEALVALSEFVLDRKEAILAGAYEVEIADLDEGSLMELASFGISVKQGVRFKFNIDLNHI